MFFLIIVYYIIVKAVIFKYNENKNVVYIKE